LIRRLRPYQHLALAEAQVLVELEQVQVAQDLAISKTEPVLIFSMYSRYRRFQVAESTEISFCSGSYRP